MALCWLNEGLVGIRVSYNAAIQCDKLKHTQLDVVISNLSKLLWPNFFFFFFFLPQRLKEIVIGQKAPDLLLKYLLIHWSCPSRNLILDILGDSKAQLAWNLLKNGPEGSWSQNLKAKQQDMNVSSEADNNPFAWPELSF